MEFECQLTSCEYRTPNLEPALAMDMLKMHFSANHSSMNAVVSTAKAEKVPRPVVKLDMGEDDFLFFLDGWSSYKRATGLVDVQMVRDQQ